MNPNLEAYQNYWAVNGVVFRRYIKAALVITAVLLGYLLIEEHYRYLIVAIVPVAVIMCVSNPRLAVYQFMVLLFSNAMFSRSPVILWLDLSACLLVCAAMLDFLLEYAPPRGFPKLTLNWVLLLVALFITSVAGHNFMLGLKPMARITLMAATFLSVYRLSRHFTLRHLVTLFFWLAVLNAFIALSPLAVSQQADRLFGLGRKTLDDIMMITLPMGLAFYLWSDKKTAPLYLLGSGFIFLTLLATQSRLPTMFALAFSALVMFLALRLIGRKKASGEARSDSIKSRATVVRTRRRTKLTLLFGTVLVAVMVALRPEVMTVIWQRFESLITQTTGGSVAQRLVLWGNAWHAFRDNPLFGLGPGNFDVIQLIYYYLRFDPIQVYVHGLSAHNLILHYMAETGIVGTSVLIALLIRQLRLARAQFSVDKAQSDPVIAIILYVLAAMFLINAFFEAAWMWGQMSFVFVFFLALIVRSHDRTCSVR
ncbi:MAG: O-antigen ligase family protein [Candidatus Zixiibacteriota bacterium]|nr:MAG: O-antigen ligase family protein [candidate division Zixibacteria bacterium]